MEDRIIQKTWTEKFFFIQTYSGLATSNKYIEWRYGGNFTRKEDNGSLVERIKRDGDIHHQSLRHEERTKKIYLNLCNFNLTDIKEIKRLGIRDFHEYIGIMGAESKKRKLQNLSDGHDSTHQLRGRHQPGKKGG